MDGDGGDVYCGVVGALQLIRQIFQTKSEYSLAIEGGDSGFSAHIPELPAILITDGSL